MFGLRYISREHKLLLKNAQDRVDKARDPKTRADAELVIQEIMSLAKPYLDCDELESQELRDQLSEQVRILEGLGKRQAAESFRMHIKDIDFHMQTVGMQKALEEEKKNHPSDSLADPPKTNSDRMLTMGQLKRDAKARQAARGRSRWTVDMDETEDE